MRRKLIGNWAVSHGPDSKVLILAVVYLCLSDRVTIDKENTDSIPAMVQCTTDPFRVCNTCRRLRASFVRTEAIVDIGTRSVGAVVFKEGYRIRSRCVPARVKPWRVNTNTGIEQAGRSHHL